MVENNYAMNNVSIAIPTFNSSEFIKETIMSCINQKNCNIEIIVSDNASSDNTIDKIKEFTSFNTIKIINNKTNIGPVRNWIKAIESCSNEYIKLLFSDDYLLTNSLTKQLKYLKNNNIGFTVSSALIGENLQTSELSYSRKFSPSKIGINYRLSYFGEILIKKRKWPYMTPCLGLFRKTDILKALNSSLKIADKDMLNTGAGCDVYVYAYLLNFYKYYVKVNQPSIFLRRHKNSFSTSIKTKNKVHNIYQRFFDTYDKISNSFL